MYIVVMFPNFESTQPKVKPTPKERSVRFLYGLIVAMVVLGFIFFLGIAGTYDTCPPGTHEDNQYGRFGGENCVSN